MTQPEAHRSISAFPIVIAVILGGLLGQFAPSVAVKCRIVGDIFLNLLFVLVIPLIMSSMISGITGLGDIRHLGSLGLKTIGFYLTTTLLAVLTGIIVVNIIAPGRNISVVQTEFPDLEYSISPRPLSGGSVLSATGGNEQIPHDLEPGRHRVRLIDQSVTGTIDTDSAQGNGDISIITWVNRSGEKIEPLTSGTGIRILPVTQVFRADEVLNNYIPRNIFHSMAESNIFPLILFSLFFGAVLSTIGETGAPLIQVIHAVNVTMMRCIVLIMYVAPIGIFGLIAARVGEAQLSLEGGFLAELARMAKYAFSVVFSLFIHGCITLPLILWILGRRRPFPFFKNLIPQLLTAFSTASSMATLPVALQLVTEKNKVSERIANFVLPLGATVNMDGTAMYEGVAAIFIAQLYNIPLGPGQQLIILITATIAGIGAAAIPQAGLVTMVLVLKSVGLPLEGIGVLLTIDWFLDRLRTTVNSWGDVVGAAVIDRYEGNGTRD